MELEEELSLMEDTARQLYRSKTRLKKMREMKRSGIGFGKMEDFLSELTKEIFHQTGILREKDSGKSHGHQIEG